MTLQEEHERVERVSSPATTQASQLAMILYLVRDHTGVDAFSVRESTVIRRAKRHMARLGIRDLETFARLLESDQLEMGAFAKSLTRSRRGLFEDGEFFDAIRSEILTRLTGAHSSIRVWVPNCGTGEEAYAFAIALIDHAETTGARIPVKVFATDASEELTARAAQGVFPAASLSKLPARFLERYFVRSGSGYKVTETVRKNITFAVHDLLTDPPFSRLDIVAARGVFAWHRTSLRDTLTGRLLFGIRNGGFLTLGRGDRLTGLTEGCRLLSPNWGIYQKMSHDKAAVAAAFGTSPPRLGKARPSHPGTALYRCLTDALLSHGPNTSFLLDAHYEVQWTYGSPTEDQVSTPRRRGGHILKVVAPPYRPTVVRLLSESSIVGHSVSARVVHADGEKGYVAIRTLGVGSRIEGYVVTLRDSAPRDGTVDEDPFAARVHTLEQRVRDLGEQNDALQSHNEELQAAKEDLIHNLEACEQRIEDQIHLTSDLENLLQNTDVGIIFLDDELRIRKYTSAIQRVINPIPEDIGRPIGELVHRFGDFDLMKACERVARGHQAEDHRLTIGDTEAYLVRIAPNNDALGRPDGILVSIVDVSALSRAQRSLETSEARFRQLAENINEVLWIRRLEPDGIEYLSPAFETVFGRPADEVLEDPERFWDAVVDEDRECARNRCEAGLVDGSYDIEYRIRRPDGSIRWLRDRAFPIRTNDGSITNVAGLCEDISEQKETERELVTAAKRLDEQAHCDPLTGIANRRGLERAMTAALNARTPGDSGICAILCDCDDFKGVNDALGHATGDIVLKEIARRLADSLRPEDILARVGGDEFIAFLRNTPIEEAERIAERLRLAVAETPLSVDGELLRVTASFGVTVVSPEVVATEELLSATHASLAASKRSGKNRVVAARDEGARAEVRDSTSIAGEILRRNDLRVAIQSIVDLESGSRVGYELLTRGPSGAFESPEALFSLFGDANMLTTADMRCLKNCIAAATTLPRDMRLHLNLLPSTLLDILPGRIEALARDVRDPERICIEISEKQFLGEVSHLLAGVSHLRERGMRIAIDDVGFGNSCFESLILLEPDVIKVDRRLVTHAAEEAGCRTALERLAAVAMSLDAEIIAEGVEDEAAADVLRSIGIRLAQGYHFDLPNILAGEPPWRTNGATSQPSDGGSGDRI